MEKADIDELRSQLKSLLSKRGDIHVEPGQGQVDVRLGIATQDFFSNYGRISTKRGGLEVAADLICESEYFNGCISLGHFEYWEIVVRPGSDAVFIVDGSEGGLDETDAVYQTIYHYLLSDLQLGTS